MSGIFEGITKYKVKKMLNGMDDDGKDDSDIPFDDFKKFFNVDTTAKSINNIDHSVTIRMNEVGHANWNFKVSGDRNVHIKREKKVPWEHPESDIP